MSLEKCSARLAAVTTRICEEMCFAFAEPDTSIDASASPTAIVELRFAGPTWGTLRLTAWGDDLIDELATGMLGLDEPPSEEDRLDSLKELANVLCGNLLPEIAGAEKVFDLGPPGPVSADTEPAPGATAVADIAMSTGLLRVHLWLDDPTVCAA